MYNLPAASQNVWMLLVMGVVFFAIYFVVFSLVIRMFNLKTPGREDKEDEIVTEEANSNTEEGLNQLATNYIAAVGGTDNLKAIDACITRLRLTVVDSARVNDAMCKTAGCFWGSETEQTDYSGDCWRESGIHWRCNEESCCPWSGSRCVS